MKNEAKGISEAAARQLDELLQEERRLLEYATTYRANHCHSLLLRFPHYLSAKPIEKKRKAG